ncbi:MAG: hypothetical protein ACD_75C00165G0003 [uncultured bacterium]|nr:MAG: hypothetical protein ACD_75C00165G0003 [uncultured bacterium]
MAGIGTGMVQSVPEEYIRGFSVIQIQKKCSHYYAETANPGGQKIDDIVKSGRGHAELPVFVVFVADHRIHSVHRLVKKSADRGTSDGAYAHQGRGKTCGNGKKKRCGNPVDHVFGDRLDAGPADSGFVQLLGFPPNYPTDSLPCLVKRCR